MNDSQESKAPGPKPDLSLVTGRLSVANTTDQGRRSTDKSRYIMIGGFLGAGKTTSVASLARWLSERGVRVGLITNDQGSRLADTALLRSRGFATEEIPGGCFCCRFNSLLDAANKLNAATRPDVLVAEPVGSCTDLVATVTYPLRRIYGNNFSIAPLSVLVDPIRARRVFGLETGGTFSERVLYIYRKQLEEADLIVVNKSDLLGAAPRQALRGTLEREFPRAEVLEISARQGVGLDAWFERVTSREQVWRAPVEVDYERYAQGEALLGWLNCTIRLAAENGFDANAVLNWLAAEIQGVMRAGDAEVAHLKMTLSPDTGLGAIAAINLVRNEYVPELSLTLDEPVESGQLIINLRAEAAPETLRDGVQGVMARLAQPFPGLHAQLEHVEHFRPGKPQPTHRLSASVAPQ